jgi:ABC-type spermidine/putrescine transport system permease subunit I
MKTSPQVIASTIAVAISATILAISVGYALGYAEGHRFATKKRTPVVVYTTACEAPLRVSVR